MIRIHIILNCRFLCVYYFYNKSLNVTCMRLCPIVSLVLLS